MVVNRATMIVDRRVLLQTQTPLAPSNLTGRIYKILDLRLFRSYFNQKNVNLASQARNWPKIISSVESCNHPLVQDALREVENMDRESILKEAENMVRARSIAEFFSVETHGEVDPGQILVNTWGLASIICESKYFPNNLSAGLISNLRDCLRKGYIFLRAVEIVEKDDQADAAYYKAVEAQMRKDLTRHPEFIDEVDVDEAISELAQKLKEHDDTIIITVPAQYKEDVKHKGLKRGTGWDKQRLLVGTIGREPYVPGGESRIICKIKVKPLQVMPRFTREGKFMGVVVIRAAEIPPEQIIEIQE